MAATARRLTTSVLTRRLLLLQQPQGQGQVSSSQSHRHRHFQLQPKINHSQFQTARTLSSSHPKCESFPSLKNVERKIDGKTKIKTLTTPLYPSSEVYERIDWEELLDPDPVKRGLLEANLKRRGEVDVDLGKILTLYESVTKMQKWDLLDELISEVLKIPNSTHPASWNANDENMDANIVHLEGEHSTEEKPEFHAFCKHKNLLRTDNLGNLTGNRGYYLKGPLAELEQALIRFTVDTLVKNGFELISVPDIINPRIVEACGFPISGARNQIYFLPPYNPDDPNSESCLSGTSEMAIGGFLHNQILSLDQLPLKFAAVSRCYRAENSTSLEEAGLYRVHYFTKVEMFGVTIQEESESNALHESFQNLQQNLFRQCSIPYRVLEMPPTELGDSAYRKFDIEAWMPGRKMYGEISSCSNCTDYQSKRLNIRYRGKDGNLRFAHTVNGTACAVPRMLISIVENNQCPDGSVDVPTPIQHFMTRTWKESAAVNPNVEYNFLRTKSQQDRVTSEYL